MQSPLLCLSAPFPFLGHDYYGCLLLASSSEGGDHHIVKFICVCLQQVVPVWAVDGLHSLTEVKKGGDPHFSIQPLPATHCMHYLREAPGKEYLQRKSRGGVCLHLSCCGGASILAG